jgi:hypothetical protein
MKFLLASKDMAYSKDFSELKFLFQLFFSLIGRFSPESIHGRLSEAGVLVRNLRPLTPLSKAKQANPRCFILLCGISCELAGCVQRHIMDSESTKVGYTLALPA